MNQTATTGRRAQKARTREALLAAAREILGEGHEITVALAADRAGISRATAYRYFSEPRTLAAEAGLALEVRPYEEVIAGQTTPRGRVLAVSRYILDLSLAHEAEFRRFLAANLEASVAEGLTRRERRGARRVQMFEAALAGTGRNDLRPLVTALTAATGAEAMIALLDIARVSEAEAREAVQTIAEALLDRFGIA